MENQPILSSAKALEPLLTWFVKQSQCPAYWTNHSDHIQAYNTAFKQALQIDDSNIYTNCSYHDFLNEASSSQLLKNNATVISQKNFLFHETYSLKKENHFWKGDIYKAPFYSGNQLIGILHVFFQEKLLDHIQKKLEPSLLQSNIYLLNIVRNMPGSIYWKDKNGIFLGCNQFVADMAGVNTPEEIIGKTDKELVWKSIADNIRENDLLIMQSQKEHDFEEHIELPNLSKKMIMLTHKAPLFNDQGEVIGIIGNSIDITDKKQLETKLVQAKEAAELANQAKTEFMRNMRHDLRTPLYGITGIAGKILSDNKDKSLKTDISDILIAGNQLLSLLNQILSYIEAESSELPLKQEIFSLKDLIDNLIGLLKPSLIDKSLKFTFHYDENIPKYLVSDVMRLHRIILNILSNAIKFTDKNGTVTLNIKLLHYNNTYNSCEIKISVKDSGIGISKADLNNIFAKFNRLHPAYEGKYQGSGLGLSIVEQFMDELDAIIHVDSKLGKGTDFSCIFTFKVSENQFKKNDIKNIYPHDNTTIEINNIKNNIKQKNTSSVKSTEAHILLVEDNIMVSRVISSSLEKLGYTVDLAANGKKAISLTNDTKYDLIFMDIGLPVEDGFAITQKIRAAKNGANKSTPIIAQTAHLDDEQKQKGAEAGMNDMVEKPLSQKKAYRLVEYYTKNNGTLSKNTEKNSSDIINYELGKKRISGDIDAAKEILKMMIDALPNDIIEITAAYQQQDYTTVRQVLHKLRGGVAFCGVPRLEHALITFHDAIKKENSPETLEKLFQLFCNEAEQLIKFFNKH